MSDDLTVRFGADADELLASFDEISARQDRVAGGFDTQADAAQREAAAVGDLAAGLGTAAASTQAFGREAEAANQSVAKGAMSAEQWQAALRPIDRAFSTSVKGIIQGTTTMQQAGARAAQSLALSFADAAEKMLTKWIASQLAMTSTTEAGAAQRAAAEQGAESTSLVGMAVKAVKAILNDSAEAFAGVFAFLAPVMGPAAAGPATAASATVAAAAGGIVSAAGGWERVPFDGALAELHKDEMVLPATLAQSLRDLTGAGTALPGALSRDPGALSPGLATTAASGGSASPMAVSFAITSPDARSFRQMLLDEHGAVADALRKATRTFRAARV